MFKYPLLVMT